MLLSESSYGCLDDHFVTAESVNCNNDTSKNILNNHGELFT